MSELSAIESVFLAALDKPTAAERAAFLDAACPEPEVRRQVERLLAAQPQLGDFLQRLDPVRTEDHQPLAEEAGAVIGPYKLMEQIGEGGMGLVFVAEQHQPVRRKVALKVIKPGMDTRQVVARFEAERQALAMMDHPHIARVLDAGATDSGRPYFVMELVRGVPITDYCDTHNLTPKERLGLFVQVCQAVQHAHHKGVIHRDLKPSNIMVAPHDGLPVVKVIDFGVAKALGQQLTEKTIYTRFAQMIGTPLYMAPEQAEVNQLDVDTRSDIYSLGVLLYELLTGTTPFDRQRFQQAAFDEIRRIIKEEEPPKPSTRLTSLGATLSSVSARRSTAPSQLSRLVRGELDWIVMRCLEKDRTRRYDTAIGLAKDVERYLAHEPVEARPASTWYRLRKLYQRNRAALTVAGGFAALLLVGLALVTWKWQGEVAARAEANAARREAEENARQVLDGAERMNEATAAMNLAGQFLLQGRWAPAEANHNRAIELRPDLAQLWLQRGDLYANLSLWDLAARDYARAFDLHPPDNVRPWLERALLLLILGDGPAYGQLCKQIVERFGAQTDPFVRGHLMSACSLRPGVSADLDHTLGPYHVEVLPRSVQWIAHYSRGIVHYRAGRYHDAIADLRASLAKVNVQGRALNYPVLALALHQSGQVEAARQELLHAHAELEKGMTDSFNNRSRLRPWTNWTDWVQLQVTYQEAQRVIEKTPPLDDPRLPALRGRALAVLGQRERAEVAYARALQLAPNDVALRAETFRFHADAKRWPEADVELAVLKNLHPRPGQACLEAFRAFAANDRWDRATAELAMAVRLDPDNLHVRLDRYRFHLERGERSAAEAAYTEATQAHAGDVPFRLKCGNVCADFGDWARARDEYTCILDVDILGDGDLNRSAWLRLAVLQLYFGNVADYRRICTRLVDRHADHPNGAIGEMLVRLCLLHPDPGVEPARVADLAKRMARQRGNRDFDLHVVAVACERAGIHDANVPALRAALDKYGWTPQRVALAHIHQRQGQHHWARSYLSRLPESHRKLEIVPGGGWENNLESQLWHRQAETVIQSERWATAESLAKRREWAAAVAAFDDVLKPDNKHGLDWQARGDCLAALGRWQEAAADFARADALAPAQRIIALRWGCVLLLQGDRAGYRELCRRMVERDADSTLRENLNNTAWLCSLDPTAREEVALALPRLEKALANASSGTFAHTRACALYRLGRYDEALKQLNELLARPGYPANAWDWLFLAMTHHRLGDRERAQHYLQQALAWIAAQRRWDWRRQAELDILRAEAEKLLGK